MKLLFQEYIRKYRHLVMFKQIQNTFRYPLKTYSSGKPSPEFGFNCFEEEQWSLLENPGSAGLKIYLWNQSKTRITKRNKHSGTYTLGKYFHLWE